MYTCACHATYPNIWTRILQYLLLPPDLNSMASEQFHTFICLRYKSLLPTKVKLKRRSSRNNDKSSRSTNKFMHYHTLLRVTIALRMSCVGEPIAVIPALSLPFQLSIISIIISCSVTTTCYSSRLKTKKKSCTKSLSTLHASFEGLDTTLHGETKNEIV